MAIKQLVEQIPNLKIKPSGWSECACPYCGDTKQHMQITPDWKWARCFRCGISVPIDDLLKMYGISENITEEFIKNHTEKEKKLKPIIPLKEGMPFTESEIAIGYLNSRDAIDVAYFEKWMFALYGRFKNRIVIPIREKGNIYGLIGRTVINQEPRYLFSSGFNGQQLFYHYDFLFGKKIFILTEGVFDCITTQKALPFVGVVALFGKELSEHKAFKLINLAPEEIAVMLDSEDKDTEIGQAVNKITRKLDDMGNCRLSVITLDDGDANSSSLKEIQRAFYNRKVVN